MQCEEWKFLFWVEFEHSFSKFGGPTVIIYIMLRYANSFLWKLEKAGNFKSQMEFLLRKHHTFENPISPSACNIFEVLLCIVAMMISLDHILYLLHDSTPSSKVQLFTLSVSKDWIPFLLALIWLGKCATVVASWQKLHERSSMYGLKLLSSSNPLQGVLCQGPFSRLVVWLILTHWAQESSQCYSFLGKCKEKAILLQINANKSAASIWGKSVREVRNYFLSSHIQRSVIFIIILFFFPDRGNEVHRLWIQAQYRNWVNNRSH